MTKQQLRQTYKARRLALTLPQQHGLLAKMMSHFEPLCMNRYRYLLSFKPMEQRNEVPVFYFEEMLTERLADLKLAYPAADFDTGEMQAFVDDGALQWQQTPFGMEQPVAGQLLSIDEIDLVFVPLLAVDAAGQRVGYGKGFYDRYLAKCSASTTTIGFSFFDVLSTLVEIDPWDVPLDYCVTPQQLYVF